MNHTSADVTVRITNFFRSFEKQVIKRGKEVMCPFHPHRLFGIEEYFWLKVWYQNNFVKILAYGGKRGNQSYIYKIRKDGIYGKPVGSTDSKSVLIQKWDQTGDKTTETGLSKSNDKKADKKSEKESTKEATKQPTKPQQSQRKTGTVS